MGESEKGMEAKIAAARERSEEATTAAVAEMNGLMVALEARLADKMDGGAAAVSDEMNKRVEEINKGVEGVADGIAAVKETVAALDEKVGGLGGRLGPAICVC